MKLGQPNLSEMERRRSQGVAVLYYVAEVEGQPEDYRCKWFTAPWFTDDEDEWWTITRERVKEDYVPKFQTTLAEQWTVPGEPQHCGFEVYWDGMLVAQGVFDDYTPVPIE